MRVIDLLNKIANNEIVKLPKIIINGKLYEEEINKEKICYAKGYISKQNNGIELSTLGYLLSIRNLNDEIEVIEETEKIEKIEIDNMDRIKAISTGNFVYSISQPMKIIIKKLNEVIDKLNKMEENK